MMLTEKECAESLGYIWNLAIDEVDRRRIPYDDLRKSVKTLQKLIEEHFDNPPLKFEEIKENDVIFDKELKETIKIKDKFIFDDIKNITFEIFGSNRTYAGTYEENRFYRKEVVQK